MTNIKDKINYKLVNILLIILIIYSLYLIRDLYLGIIEKIIEVFLPFVIAFVVAYALNPLVKRIEKYNIKRGICIALIYLLVSILISIIIVNVVPLFYEQIILLLSNTSVVIADISYKYNLNLEYLQRIIAYLFKNINNNIVINPISILNTSINILTNIIIIIVVSIYFLSDMNKLRTNIKYKLYKKNKLYKYFIMLDNELSNYFNGLFKGIIIQSIEYTIIFFLIGHPNYLILGVLAGLTNIIPYFGALVVNMLAIVIASVIDTKLLLLTIIVCLVLPNIDSYIIGPKIYRKTNNIPALVNIFSVFAGGVIGGFFGILISLPVAIILISSFKFIAKDSRSII